MSYLKSKEYTWMKTCQNVLALAAIFSMVFASSGSVFALANSEILPNQLNSQNINNHQKENRFNPVYKGICDVKPNDPKC